MAVQQFCLRWNNHQPNFISVFTNLLNNESLVDVTLAAEGKQLKAHKVVLSACSTYFQSLFTANPCQHPIVILKDVKYKDLKTMVDFMYQGEVNVSQEQLPAILKTAETLKVKGLAEMPEQLSLSKSMSQSSDKCESPPAASVLRRKRFRKSSTGSGSEQTSEETAASGGDMSSVKHDPDDTVGPQHRRDTSTESEPTTREGSHSFDDDVSTPRNISEDAGDSNIRWSSSEEKASTSQGTPQGGDPVPTPSMGSKRGRLLMRQHRVKKEIEMSQAEGDGEPSVHRLVERQSSEPVHRLVERQCSEPAPNLLAVPQQHAYLIKQNSSPHLSQVNPPTTTSSSSTLSTSIPTVHIQAPSSDNSNPIPLTSMRQRIEELRRSTSTPQCLGSGTETCEGSRSCHCPVLRPGPALGCNFCWNTVDTHGRILRRKTKYHCPECQTNLCIVPCFQEYHERHGSGSGYREGPSTCSPSSGTGMIPTIMKTSSL